MDDLDFRLFDDEAALEVVGEKYLAGPRERRRLEQVVSRQGTAEADTRREFEHREGLRIWYDQAAADSRARQRKRDGIPAGTVDDPDAADVLVGVFEELGLGEDAGLEAARFFDLAVEQIAIRIAERVAEKLRGELTRGIALGAQDAVEQILNADADRLQRAAARREAMREWEYQLDDGDDEEPEITNGDADG